MRLSPGTHRLSESLVLGPEHSGSADASVTFRGSGAGETVLSSGYALQGWTRVGEDMPDVPKELRGKVWMTDLPANAMQSSRKAGYSIRICADSRSRGGSPPVQHDVDPRQYTVERRRRELARPLGQIRPVERDELRHVGD